MKANIAKIMNAKQPCTIRRKDKMVLSIAPEFYSALEEMALACGITGEKAVDRFASELMEVAVVEVYKKRFYKTVSGFISPSNEPAPESNEDDEEE